MKIIPVVDLLAGVVVHANRGERDLYRPVVTVLCTDPSPTAVIDALLKLHPFNTFYIADLDALIGRGNQYQLIRQLAQRYPLVTFWVDQGGAQSQLECTTKNCLSVFGSESMNKSYRSALIEQQERVILSLDFSAGELIGPQTLLTETDSWPETVILMNLSRVGAHQGPDLEQLAWFISHSPGRKFVAAGGVRGGEDLAQLESVGAKAVLIATALHEGRITPQQLARY